jgi:hypothetical protein
MNEKPARERLEIVYVYDVCERKENETKNI